MTFISVQGSQIIGSPSIIPKPASYEEQAGTFTLTPQVPVITDAANEANGRYLHSLLCLPAAESGDGIHLTINKNLNTAGAEGYRLEMSPAAVHISAPSRAGVFYGIQSLRQLLPADQAPGAIPCLVIEDRPSFSWRGFMRP